jgi:hypothetical protein
MPLQQDAVRLSVGTSWRALLAFAGLTSLLIAAPAHAASSGSPAALSSHPIAANGGWTKYVEAPSSPAVRPVSVVSTTGEVSNPDALLGGHSGSTTLSYPQGGTDWDTNFTHPAGDYAADSIVHYESLLDGGALAKAVGDSSSAQMYLDDAATEKAAINSNLWDPSLGGYDASTAERGFLVQDANVWAVLYGVASPTQSQLILKHLASGLASPWGMLAFASTAPPDYTFTVISPYVGSFTVWADYQAGRPDLRLGLMQTEWGWMVNHDPQSTDWERIQSAAGDRRGRPRGVERIRAGRGSACVE